MFKSIRTFFKGKRIIEVNGRFIPQILVRDGLMFKWHGIAVQVYSTYSEFGLVSSWDDQPGRCGVLTIDKATQYIHEYTRRAQEAKQKSKKVIHDVECEIWTKLKQ